jgi:inner membrane transporter RhtA
VQGIDRQRATSAVLGAPPAAYFATSAVFHYLGPAFAVLLFARLEPLGVAGLRIATAAVILGVWRRPWRLFRAWPTATRRLVVAWGLVLATMNVCFYEAIARLPLGTVAAIEFVPVVVLASLGARTPRNGAALALAVGGVALLTNVQLDGQPLGVAFAAANAVLYMLYIVLGHRVAAGGAGSGVDGLAASMLVAAIACTPVAAHAAAPALTEPVLLLAAIGVGISSSVVPYVADQLALARLPRATYALMVSLLPAIAVLTGLAVLQQVPQPAEAAGVALVVAGVALHRDPDPT